MHDFNGVQLAAIYSLAECYSKFQNVEIFSKRTFECVYDTENVSTKALASIK